MRILVTGSEGFIGSHLAELLLELDHEVTALVQYNSFGLEGWLSDIPKNRKSSLKVVHGDVRDAEQMRRISTGQDWIFHLAALIGIPYSYEAARSYVQTNIVGTLNMLEAAREADVKKIMVTSTSEVYGSAMTVPMNENHPRQPQSPYSASKIAADALALSYFYSFDLPVTVARPFNTYGPRQSLRAVIPTIVLQLLSKPDKLEIGNLDATRDFNFVTDTAEGLLKLMESGETTGRELNLASGSEISISQLVLEIAEKVGIPLSSLNINSIDERKRPPSSEVNRLLGDAQLAMRLSDWKPKVSLSEGLDKTIEWMKSTNKSSAHLYETSRTYLT